MDQVNNYSCICNVGFAGQHCDVAITHCSNDSCYPGVPCTENSNAISCGSCPSGFIGDGKNCKGKICFLTLSNPGFFFWRGGRARVIVHNLTANKSVITTLGV